MAEPTEVNPLGASTAAPTVPAAQPSLFRRILGAALLGFAAGAAAPSPGQGLQAGVGAQLSFQDRQRLQARENAAEAREQARLELAQRQGAIAEAQEQRAAAAEPTLADIRAANLANLKLSNTLTQRSIDFFDEDRRNETIQRDRSFFTSLLGAGGVQFGTPSPDPEQELEELKQGVNDKAIPPDAASFVVATGVDQQGKVLYSGVYVPAPLRVTKELASQANKLGVQVREGMTMAQAEPLFELARLGASLKSTQAQIAALNERGNEKARAAQIDKFVADLLANNDNNPKLAQDHLNQLLKHPQTSPADSLFARQFLSDIQAGLGQAAQAQRAIAGPAGAPTLGGGGIAGAPAVQLFAGDPETLANGIARLRNSPNPQVRALAQTKIGNDGVLVLTRPFTPEEAAQFQELVEAHGLSVKPASIAAPGPTKP